MPCQHPKTSFLNRIKLSLRTNGSDGKPRNLDNFANWPVEFGKICRGKLWALLIGIIYYDLFQ